nr:3454_t:CDS:2 [Entrophospora candida]
MDRFMKYEIKIYLFEKYLISGIQRACALVHGRAVCALFKVGWSGTPNDLTIRNRLKLNDPLDKQSLSTKESFVVDEREGIIVRSLSSPP